MTYKASVIVALLSVLGGTSLAAQVDGETIAKAVLPLPPSMRAEAAVFTYDESGARQMLRQGSNAVECKIKDENGHTWCYPKSTAARRDYKAIKDSHQLRQLVSAQTMGVPIRPPTS